MEANTSVVAVAPVTHKTAWVLKVIGVLYVLIVVYVMSQNLLFGGIATFGRVSAFNVVVQWQMWMYGGLLVLSFVEVVGLWTRRSWARWFGIILGILILASGTLLVYALGSTSITLILSVLLVPMNLVVLAAIIYLAIPKVSDGWESSGVISVVSVSFLAILEIVLLVAYLYYSHTLRP